MDPIDEYYCELNPIEKEIVYKYQCRKCGFEEWSPAFVVDEIAYMDEILEEDYKCEDLGISILICPRCIADFLFTGDIEKQYSGVSHYIESLR